jgi:signal transduction histidine kinase/CheY-like chemotaxis protein
MARSDFTEHYFQAAMIFTAISLIVLAFLLVPNYIGQGSFIHLIVPAAFCAIMILLFSSVLKALKRKWQSLPDMGYFQTVNLLTLFSIAAYYLIKSPEFLSQNQYLMSLGLIGLCVTAMSITIYLMVKVDKISALAFLVPLNVFIIFTAGTIFTGGSYYYFNICLIIFGIGAAYCQERSYFYLMIIVNVSTLGFIYFDFPVFKKSDYLESPMFCWATMVYGSIFFMLLSKYSNEKMSRSSKALDSFNTLMNTTPNLLALIDNSGRVTYISRALAELAHVEDYEMASGRPLIDLFSQLSLKMLVSEVMNTKGFYQDTKELRLHAEPHHFKIIADDLFGSSEGKFIDITDITPIVLAKQEAERSAEVKSLFLANTSHENRTPMNAILGMTELILRNTLTSDTRDKVLAIRQAGVNLMSIINDILDFSKIESGKVDILPSEYETASLLTDVVNIISLKLAEKNLSFVAAIDSTLPKKLYGDENRLRQILLNLLSNAAKYTPNGQVTFTVQGQLVKEDEILLTFEIQDTGIGIKDEEIDKLFGIFSRLDYVKNRGIEGTGLGLAISLKLCRLMGGDIKVKSTYGQGSTFTVILSQKILDPEAMVTVKAPMDKNVLIFETRPYYLETLEYCLGNLKVPYLCAEDKESFLLALEMRNFPFIFISPLLYESVRLKIRELSPGSHVTVLAADDNYSLADKYKAMTGPIEVITLGKILNGPELSAAQDSAIPYQELFSAPEARVLIVDDIDVNLKVAEGLLEPYMVQVDLCTNGRDAVTLARKKTYDLIFMDHMMPEMDGVEATAVIRSSPQMALQQIPIIALTANAVLGMREMFLKNGFNDYLPKPIPIADLHEIMNRWIPPDKRQKPKANYKKSQNKLFQISGLNTDLGLVRTGGSIQKYKEILDTFHQDVVSRLDILKSVPDEDNLENFTIHIHAIKSASASVGGLELASYAAKLEEAGNLGNFDSIKKILPIFLENLVITTENIKAFFQPDIDEENRETLLPLDVSNLVKLKNALAAEKIREIDEIISILMENGGAKASLLNLISNHVLMYEFDMAKQIVNDLLAD